MNDIAELRRNKYRNGIGDIQHRRDMLLLSQAETVTDTEDAMKNLNPVQYPDKVELETQVFDVQPEMPELDSANIEQAVETHGLVVIEDAYPPLQPGDEYWEEKKKLFGGSKMVKRTVK